MSQGKMNLNRFFVHQSDRAIAVFFSFKTEMILLAIENESSHIQLTWRHMKIKHKSGKWIASNRFKSNVAFGFS